MPGAVDAEAFKIVANQRPDPRVYPNAFSWYAMVSKFSPDRQAAWKWKIWPDIIESQADLLKYSKEHKNHFILNIFG